MCKKCADLAQDQQDGGWLGREEAGGYPCPSGAKPRAGDDAKAAGLQAILKPEHLATAAAWPIKLAGFIPLAHVATRKDVSALALTSGLQQFIKRTGHKARCR